MFNLLLDLAFSSIYGTLVFGIALLAAIPYGIWRGLVWVGSRLKGGHHGDSRAGS